MAEEVEAGTRSSQILNTLKRSIEMGRYSKAGMLPSFEDLADRFEVSVPTVREAISVLERLRLVEVKQGRGTFLTERAHAVARRIKPPDAHANFAQWKDLVKLTPDFPRLGVIPWKQLDERHSLYLREDHRRARASIEASAHAAGDSRLYVPVVVPRGHGCSTLARHIYKRLTPSRRDEPNEDRRGSVAPTIPVRISWSRLGVRGAGSPPVSLDKLRANFHASIREDLLRGLTWDQWLSGSLDAWKYEALLARIEGTPQEKRDALDRALPPEQLESDALAPPGAVESDLLSAIPGLASSSTFIAELEQKGIRTLLLIDYSWGTLAPSEDRRNTLVDELIGIVKDLGEHLPPRSSAGQPMRAMHFLDGTTQKKVQAVLSRDDDDKISVPSYAQADIFGILARHYPTMVEIRTQGKETVSQSTVDLAALVKSTVLSVVEDELSKTNRTLQDIGLNEITQMMEEKILESMERPWEDLTYHLPL